MIRETIGAGCAAFIIVVCLVFGLGTGSPIVPKWAVIYGGSALTLAYFAYIIFINGKIALSISDFSIIAFLAYLCLTLLWSSDPQEGFLIAEAMIALAIIYTAFKNVPRKTLVIAVYVSTTIALTISVIFGWSYQLIYGGAGNENFQSELMLVLLPIVIASWCAVVTPAWWIRPFSLIATGTAIHFLLVVNLSDNKWVAVSMVLLALLIWLIRQRRYVMAGLGFLVPLNIALWSGWVMSPIVVKAIAHRLEIGINSAVLFLEKPLFGHGLGSFNFEYGRVQEAHLQFFPNMDTVLRPAAVFAGAAHNEFLQLGVDAGLIGVALAFVLCGFLVHRFFMKKRDALDVGAAITLLIALGLSQISFPMQNPATGCMVVIAAAVLMHGQKGAFVVQVPKLLSRCISSVAVVMGCGLVLSSYLNCQAETLFTKTKANILKANPTALQANIDAYEMYPLERRYRHQLVLTVGSLLKRGEGNITITDMAADRAYAISKSSSQFMPSIQMSRVEYLLNSGRWKTEKKEMESLLGWLKVHASLQPGVWVAEGNYALRLGDVKRILSALDAGTTLPTNSHQHAFEKLASHLRVNKLEN